jgi:hypothetical protein
MAQAAAVRGLVAVLFSVVWLGCAGHNDALLATGLDAKGDGSIGNADGAVDRTPLPPVDAAPERPAFSSYCYNGDKDPNETDFDCGGNCAPCDLGKKCIMTSDCAKGTCVGGVCTGPASCSNRMKDPSETDVDCGGAECAGCASGKKCKTAADCASGTCTGGTCG